MVLFFTSTAVEPPATIYMGKDKFENEDLIKYGDEYDVWFHVDKISSAHVYLRLTEGMSWDAIPAKLLEDCAQLVKANSIEGNKRDNQTIIYTPWSNVKKTGDMAVGAVTFHNDKKVKRTHVRTRDNAVVNRLNKTKRDEVVDHEAVRIERLRQKQRLGRERERAERKDKAEEARRHRAEKEAKDYSALYSDAAIAEAKRERERRERARRQEERERLEAGGAVADGAEHAHAGGEGGDGEEDRGLDSDDSFM